MDNNKKIGKGVLARLGLLATAVAAMGGIGCNGGGDPYYQPWYDVYGYHCGNGTPSAGCNFYGNGDKIVAGEDPSYYSSYLSYNTWFYTDSYGLPSYYTGYAWLSPSTGILYDGSGYALNNDQENESRDLMGNAAEAEARVVELAGNSFAEKFALSNETGIRVAKTLNEYATLVEKQKRSRTTKDIKDFGKRLYGVDPAKAERAFLEAKAGSAASLLEMNDEVATNWGTNPETSARILEGWYSKQLKEYNVKK